MPAATAEQDAGHVAALGVLNSASAPNPRRQPRAPEFLPAIPALLTERAARVLAVAEQAGTNDPVLDAWATASSATPPPMWLTHSRHIGPPTIGSPTRSVASYSPSTTAFATSRPSPPSAPFSAECVTRFRDLGKG